MSFQSRGDDFQRTQRQRTAAASRKAGDLVRAFDSGVEECHTGDAAYNAILLQVAAEFDLPDIDAIDTAVCLSIMRAKGAV